MDTKKGNVIVLNLKRNILELLHAKNKESSKKRINLLILFLLSDLEVIVDRKNRGKITYIDNINNKFCIKYFQLLNPKMVKDRILEDEMVTEDRIIPMTFIAHPQYKILQPSTEVFLKDGSRVTIISIKNTGPGGGEFYRVSAKTGKKNYIIGREHLK
jgi:hypothetical protein